MNKAELLGPLGKDTTKLVLDRLPPQDQWRLATSSGSLYRLFGQLSQKSIVYSFSVIPEGALEHPIFSKYPANYVALIKFLRIRERHQKFIADEFSFFDYEDVWPLVAIMGNETALRELLRENPKRLDLNGKYALDYLAFCGHKTALINWIRDFYPDFHLKENPWLHYYAALGGSEEVVFMLKEDYGYDINDSGGKKGWKIYDSPVTLLHPALWGKHLALIRRLIDAKVDLHKNDIVQNGLAITAAEMGLWDFCNEFEAEETREERDKYGDNAPLFRDAAVCANRRDKVEVYRTKCVDYWTQEYSKAPESESTFEDCGEYMGHAALRSGRIELLDWGVANGWIDISGLFHSQHNPGVKYPALFVAAMHGQLKMFDHLVGKYGLDPHALFVYNTVLEWMIITTTWSNFEYIAQKYFPDYNFFSPQDTIPLLTLAIQGGRLYHTQQYIKKYCGDDNFLRCAEDLIASAEECKRSLIAKWLKFKLASLKLAEVQSNIVEEAHSDPDRLGI